MEHSMRLQPSLKSNFEEQMDWFLQQRKHWRNIYGAKLPPETVNLWKDEDPPFSINPSRQVVKNPTIGSPDSAKLVPLMDFYRFTENILQQPFRRTAGVHSARKFEGKRTDPLEEMLKNIQEKQLYREKMMPISHQIPAQSEFPPKALENRNSSFYSNENASFSRSTEEETSKVANISISLCPEGDAIRRYSSKNLVTREDYDAWGGNVLLNMEDQDWKKEYSWTKDVKQINHEIFGNSSFRPKQMEVINAVLSQRDVFVMMPTGGGKSLCFQLPAVLSSGLTVVIMPLLSLMQDQMDQMNVLNIKCGSLYSTQSLETQNQLYDDLLHNRGINLLFVTPEKIGSSSRLLSILHTLNKDARLDRFAIDEAHCVSQWGNDFRPQYCELKKLRQDFPNVPLIGLTASATAAIVKDVITQLGMLKPIIFQLSFNRPNIRYEIRVKSKVRINEDVAALIKKQFMDLSGIIYCFSKRECEKMVETLLEKGLKAAFYHADVVADRREEVQRDWMNDDIQVIVATVAFGMGINKKNVRFVIHSAMPKSLENFYQESGRGGRDGIEAMSILFYDYYDKQRQNHLIQVTETESVFTSNQRDQKKKNEVNLLSMHFGEQFEGKCDVRCGNCRNRELYSVIARPCHEAIEKVISFIRECKKKRLDSGLTLIALREALLGKKSKRLQHMEKISYFNAFRKDKWSAEATDQLLHQMVIHQILYEKCVSSQNMFGAFTAYVDIGSAVNHHSLKEIQFFDTSLRNDASSSRFRKNSSIPETNFVTPFSSIQHLSVSTKSRQDLPHPLEFPHRTYEAITNSMENISVKKRHALVPVHKDYNNVAYSSKYPRLLFADKNSPEMLEVRSSSGTSASSSLSLSLSLKASLKGILNDLRKLLATEQSIKNASSIVSMEGIDEMIDRYGRRMIEKIREFLLENNLSQLVEEEHIGGFHAENTAVATRRVQEDYVYLGGLQRRHNCENLEQNQGQKEELRQFPSHNSVNTQNHNYDFNNRRAGQL
ncbi:ATP-dependent Dna helicase, RecQ family protein, partial [Cardiosporidium cionae]